MYIRDQCVALPLRRRQGAAAAVGQQMPAAQHRAFFYCMDVMIVLASAAVPFHGIHGFNVSPAWAVACMLHASCDRWHKSAWYHGHGASACMLCLKLSMTATDDPSRIYCSASMPDNFMYVCNRVGDPSAAHMQHFSNCIIARFNNSLSQLQFICCTLAGQIVARFCS